MSINGVPIGGGEVEFESLDVEQLPNGTCVWVWTGPGGQCHQGAKQYPGTKRGRSDALRAGREWLAKLKLGGTP